MRKIPRHSETYISKRHTNLIVSSPMLMSINFRNVSHRLSLSIFPVSSSPLLGPLKSLSNCLPRTHRRKHDDLTGCRWYQRRSKSGSRQHRRQHRSTKSRKRYGAIGRAKKGARHPQPDRRPESRGPTRLRSVGQEARRRCGTPPTYTRFRHARIRSDGRGL